MPKGLCCAAQQAGDLGKPLIVNVHRKDGSVVQRCGTCEIVPSCRDQAKMVFRFSWIPSAICNLVAAVCKPTPAGVAQYNTARGQLAIGSEATGYLEAYGGSPAAYTFTGRALPPGRPPYALPLP